jgi:hypothetical protein
MGCYYRWAMTYAPILVQSALPDGMDNIGAGTVSATENWWGCVLGREVEVRFNDGIRNCGFAVAAASFNDDRDDKRSPVPIDR